MKGVIKEFSYLMSLGGIAFFLGVVAISLIFIGFGAVSYLVFYSSIEMAQSTIKLVMCGLGLSILYIVGGMWFNLKNIVDVSFGVSNVQSE